MEVSKRDIFLVGGTRGILGAGAALLLGSKLPEDQRRMLGWTLFLTGVLSTAPLAYRIFHRKGRAQKHLSETYETAHELGAF